MRKMQWPLWKFNRQIVWYVKLPTEAFCSQIYALCPLPYVQDAMSIVEMLSPMLTALWTVPNDWTDNSHGRNYSQNLFQTDITNNIGWLSHFHFKCMHGAGSSSVSSPSFFISFHSYQKGQLLICRAGIWLHEIKSNTKVFVLIDSSTIRNANLNSSSP